MAESDFTVLSGSLDTTTIRSGVSAGAVVPPPGGGSFVYGFNSIALATGARGLFTNQVDFAPMASGGSISGVMQRGASGGPTDFAPMLFIGAQGPDVNDRAYLLGLSDGDPSRIMLKKGIISQGLFDVAPDPTNNGVLMRSTRTVEVAEWVHLRLDMIVNANGDVLLQVFENDLAAHPIGTAPDWQLIPGMEGPLHNAPAPIDGFIDDVTEVNSGSAPFTSGRAGFAMQCADVTRRAYFDQIEISRQV